MSAARLTAAGTLLFVPGHRPERFDKAAAAGAGAVVLDLEDAVGPDEKDAAREHVRAWLAAGGTGVVRVNSADTPWYADDLAAVAGAATAVMLPKAEDPAVVRATAGSAGAVLPLIETARGVFDARAVCDVPGVVRPAFGSVDLAAELSVDPADRSALQLARQTLVLAAAAARVGSPVDGVTTAYRDEELLRADIAHARALGFGAKLCIHPAQVAVAEQAYRPSDDELDWARRVTATAGTSVGTVDGQMIDKPVLERARAVLARATP